MLGVATGLLRGSFPKRARRGLFHGKQVLSGNMVSFSMRHTRRKWKPNAQRKTVYSETLNRSWKVQVTAAALRCIDKAGGLDNYLLKTKEALLPGFGRRVKYELVAAREAMGLPTQPKFYPRLSKKNDPILQQLKTS